MSPGEPSASVQKPHTCKEKVLGRPWQNGVPGRAGSFLFSQALLSLTRASTLKFPDAKNTHRRADNYSYFQGTYYMQQDRCKGMSTDLKKKSELFRKRDLKKHSEWREHRGSGEMLTISLLEKMLTGPAQD